MRRAQTVRSLVPLFSGPGRWDRHVDVRTGTDPLYRAARQDCRRLRLVPIDGGAHYFARYSDAGFYYAAKETGSRAMSTCPHG